MACQLPDVASQLPQLEAYCERLYTAQSGAERSQLEAMLGVFGQSTQYITYLKQVLDRTTQPYAQHMVATSLLKLATEHTLSPQVRAEMKAYFLSYLDRCCCFWPCCCRPRGSMRARAARAPHARLPAHLLPSHLHCSLLLRAAAGTPCSTLWWCSWCSCCAAR